MGKAFRVLGLILISVTLVLGTQGEVAAKKKKKAIKITEAEHALLDKWEAKKNEKSRQKSVKKLRKVLKKKVKYVGAAKCNGSCHDPYYEAWKES
ncbi:MAG: hypothetical protein QF745_08270, partial [Planctomycetota bacterium]|nr:hypothetical protein [Planctomycetota bacterium]